MRTEWLVLLLIVASIVFYFGANLLSAALPQYRSDIHIGTAVVVVVVGLIAFVRLFSRLTS